MPWELWPKGLNLLLVFMLHMKDYNGITNSLLDRAIYLRNQAYPGQFPKSIFGLIGEFGTGRFLKTQN